jgi:hypothetical protein
MLPLCISIHRFLLVVVHLVLAFYEKSRLGKLLEPHVHGWVDMA